MTAPTTAFQARLENRRLLPLAAAGGAIGTVFNLAIALIAPALIGGAVQISRPSSPLEDLPLIAVIAASIIPAFVAAAVLWLLGRLTKAPIQIFQIIAVVITVLSLFSPFGIPTTLGAQLTLCLMHIVAAASITLALSRAKA